MYRNLSLSKLLSLAPALIIAESVSCTGACLRCTVTCQAKTDVLQQTCTQCTRTDDWQIHATGWSAQQCSFGYVWVYNCWQGI